MTVEPHARRANPSMSRPTRKSWLSVSLALGLMCLPIGALARPNVVVVVADDWGFTDVGAFGGEIATPTLDALAARGMRFANFHTSGECSPTRAMLMTGVRSHRTGVGAMRESVPREHAGQPGYLTVLNDRVVTLGTLLQRAGYRTFAVGKWHLGKEARNLPNARGFDRSLVQGDSGSDNWDTRQRYLALTDKVNWFEDGRAVTLPRDYYSSQFFVDRAIGYLDETTREDGTEASRKPFFLYLAFQANHIPLQAPPEFIARYRGRYDAGWSAIREARRLRAIEQGLLPAGAQAAATPGLEEWSSLSPRRRAYEARRMEVYAGMAEAMDHHLGRLIAHLRTIGEYENTVFVFLSDNGAEASDPYAQPLGRLWLETQYTRDFDRLGGPGTYTTLGPNWATAAASPLATSKFYAGEGGIRVPLIIAGAPGTIAGAIHTRFAHVTDLAPTLLELTGVAHPAPRFEGRAIEAPSGRSLVSVLRGERDRNRSDDETHGYELAGNAALFRGDLKLVRNQPPVGDGRWRLFNIVADPGETQDLAASRPQEFAAMQAEYARYAEGDGVLPMPAGYEPRRQVLINALHNVIWPAVRLWLLGALLVGAALIILWRRRQRAGRSEA